MIIKVGMPNGMAKAGSNRMHEVLQGRVATRPQQSPNQPGYDAMNSTTSTIKDPVCGMTVDPITSVHADRDGKTYYFCGDKCRNKFTHLPPGAKSKMSGGSCCS